MGLQLPNRRSGRSPGKLVIRGSQEIARTARIASRSEVHVALGR